MSNVNEGSGPSVRHFNYIVVEEKVTCPQCSLVTAVFALALPAGYESFNPADNQPDNSPEAWERAELAAVLSYVGYLPHAVVNRIASLTAHYRLSSESAHAVWRNHCEHCRMAIEEELLHEDLDSPFGSMGIDLSKTIQLHQFPEPFEARVGAEMHDVEI